MLLHYVVNAVHIRVVIARTPMAMVLLDVQNILRERAPFGSSVRSELALRRIQLEMTSRQSLSLVCRSFLFRYH